MCTSPSILFFWRGEEEGGGAPYRTCIGGGDVLFWSEEGMEMGRKQPRRMHTGTVARATVAFLDPLSFKKHSQLPKTSGQDCQSIGKSLSTMGHLALIVNLEN